MTKHITFEIKSRVTYSTLATIKVTRSQALRYDEREHLMRASATFVARRKFCKDNGIDENDFGKYFSARIIEEI